MSTDIDQHASGANVTQVGNVQGSVIINDAEAIKAFVEVMEHATGEYRESLRVVLSQLLKNVDWIREASDNTTIHVKQIEIDISRFKEAMQGCLIKTVYENVIPLRQGSMHYVITEPPFKHFEEVRDTWARLDYDFQVLRQMLKPQLTPERWEQLDALHRDLDAHIKRALEADSTADGARQYLQDNSHAIQNSILSLQDTIYAIRSDLSLHIRALLTDVSGILHRVIGMGE